MDFEVRLSKFPKPRVHPTSTTAWLVALIQIKGVGIAFIRSWRTREGNCAVQRRQQPHVGDDCTQILLVEVGKLVPRHALPMELPAVPAHAAANGTFQLWISPGADAGLLMPGNIARPQRSKRLPADWSAAAAIGAVADGAAH